MFNGRTYFLIYAAALATSTSEIFPAITDASDSQNKTQAF